MKKIYRMLVAGSIIFNLTAICVLALGSNNLTMTFEFGDKGRGNGQFGYLPVAVRPLAFDKEGCIYLIDSENHRVQKFNSNGEFIMAFGNFGCEDGEFNYPSRITIDASGNIYILDTYNGAYVKNLQQINQVISYPRIQKFSPNGEFICSFGGTGKGAGCFLGIPADVATDSNGNIFIVDAGNHRIQKFGPDGKFVSAFGNYGTGPAELDNPKFIEIDNQDNIFIFDAGSKNCRIVKFAPDGTFLSTFGKEGYEDGQFTGAVLDMFIDEQGNLRVVGGFSWSSSDTVGTPCRMNIKNSTQMAVF